MKTERTQIHFLYNVFAAVASSDLKVPISCRQEWGSVLGEGGLANGRRRFELAWGLGAILPIYRIPCQEFGESHFLSSCQIPYTVQKFSLFPKPTLYFGQFPVSNNTPPDPTECFYSYFEKGCQKKSARDNPER